MASVNAATAARGPAGWSQTAEETAIMSAPASTSGAQLAAVMPPMATQGNSDNAVHQRRISGVALVLGVLVRVG